MTHSLATVEQFSRSRQPTWEELSAMLEKKARRLSAREVARVAELYREVCTDLMRAQRLGCPPQTINYLDRLVSRAHSRIYSLSHHSRWHIGEFLRRTFPRAVRANAGPLLVASLLFWVPFAIALHFSLSTEDFSSRVLPASVLEQMAESYQQDISKGRDAGTNSAMAGFYVMNNVGIAFRCFATGILFGLGSIFFLVHNGCVTGAIMGHVLRTGGGINILTFVCGHSALELGAIVIAGAAGLQMGRALVITGGKTRLGSLWTQRGSIVSQVVGAALMLLAAAAIEGFWSPSSAPHAVKWTVGGINAVLLLLYLTFAGRTRGKRSPAPSVPVDLGPFEAASAER